ncbi:MAG: hypothetical protein JSW51_09860 [Gemmatimonadota bacterium]|nr:MAG: hypothetical protein JSW51_09860 [Gemmatimonadota bacterium]
MVRRIASLTGMLGLAMTATACDVIPGIGPDDVDPYQFFSEVSLPEFEQLMQEGSGRVEVILTQDALVAREVEIRGGEALVDEEEIVGRVASIESSGSEGTLTLQLGNLNIGFTVNTAFCKGDGDLSFEQFVGHVTEAVAFEEYPNIKAQREPADQPQAPNDATFMADRLCLIGGDHANEIDINVDRDNLVMNDAPPPDGWIQVLGLQIELRVTEGITKINAERDELVKKEFAGKVGSVNLDRQAFELTDGTVVRIVDDTKIAYEAGDEHRLGSLEAVAAALEAGEKVVSAGYGVVEGTEPTTIAAMHVVFEIAPPPMNGFEGEVEQVDPDVGVVTLANGVVVHVVDATKIKSDREDYRYLTSLDAVAEALAAGETVVTWGEGTLESEDPTTIRAACIVFKLDLPAPTAFEGEILSVDETAGVVTLVNGTELLIVDETEIKHEADDPRYLTSLGAVAEALTAGETVFAWGNGIAQSEEPLVIRVHHIVFKQMPPPMEDFSGTVASVDVDAGSVTLTDGTIVCVGEKTEIAYQEGDTNRLPSLQAVADALASDTAVYTAGEGVVKGHEPLQIDAKRIVFEI